MNVYFDASALVKRHLSEPGTPEVSQIFETAKVVGTSVISRAETEAAIAKSIRTKALTEKEARAVLDDFRIDWPSFVRTSVSEMLVRRAGMLAFRHSLRGYDAVQLASALIWKESLDEEVTVATFDIQLWEAAGRYPLLPFPEDLPGLLAAWRQT